MKSIKKQHSFFVRALLGLVLIVSGFVVWGSRLNHFEPEGVIKSYLKDRLEAVPRGEEVDLTEECAHAISDDGWILFILKTTLINDNRYRTFFETAEERVGLWVEYEPGLLRLGLGLGPDNIEANRSLPIRTVRQTETTTIFIGVSRDETRVVTNARDGRISWPREAAPFWSCSNVRFADATREMSNGNACEGCEISLAYVAGKDDSALKRILDDASNVRIFNYLRWLGTALILIGVALMVTPKPLRKTQNAMTMLKSRRRHI